MQKPQVSIIAAMGKNKEIGRGGDLLWHIPDDLKRFKALTTGHPVIMGRKTWDSLPERARPLPNRTNIVVTRQQIEIPGAIVASSVSEAIEKALELDQQEVFVIGGAQIYEQALPYTDRLYLTLIDDTNDADTFFPPYEKGFTKILKNEARESNGLTYHWVDLEK